MSKFSLWIVFTTVLLVSAAQNTHAQCSFTSKSGGTTSSPLDWTAAGTWSGGSAPSTSSPSGNVCVGDGAYTSVVRINSATNFSGSVTITVKTNSTLIINGDLHIASNLTVSVELGGTLTVNGLIYTDNAGGVPKLTNLGTVTATTLTIDGAGNVTNGSAANTAAANSLAKITVSNGVNGNLNIKNSGSPSLTNYGIMSFTGSVDTYGSLTNSGTITVDVDVTAESSGGQLLTNSGQFTVTGKVNAYGKIQLNPAAAANSDMIITGLLTIDANENMKVGTGSTCTTSTYYADLVVKGNVKLIGSGDIKVYSNGRLAVFGNVDGTTSSGTLVTINCGGQAYVHGNVNLGAGGGNTVANGNGASAPTGSDGSQLIGLYVNGTVTAQNNPTNDGDANTSVGTKAQFQANDQGFFNYVAGISGSPLPITLSFFRLKEMSAEGVTLEWSTASELNFDHFNLQRSTNGKEFETVAEIQGHGTTRESHRYSFTDKMAINGVSYYRLQSIDFDGYMETFNVVAVKFDTKKGVAIFPNPVTDSSVNFQLNFEPTNEILVTVTTSTGIQKMREVIKTHFTEMKLDLTLEPGVYVIKMTSIDFNNVSRIVVK